MPRRSVAVHVRPPSVVTGIAVARSGTSSFPTSPPARRNPTSPSFVNPSTVSDDGEYVQAGSNESEDQVTSTVAVESRGAGPRETPVPLPQPPPTTAGNNATSAATTHRLRAPFTQTVSASPTLVWSQPNEG